MSDTDKAHYGMTVRDYKELEARLAAAERDLAEANEQWQLHERAAENNAALLAAAESENDELMKTNGQIAYDFAREMDEATDKLTAAESRAEKAEQQQKSAFYQGRESEILVTQEIIEGLQSRAETMEQARDKAECQLAEATDKLNTEMAEHTREVLRHGVTQARVEIAERELAEARTLMGEAAKEMKMVMLGHEPEPGFITRLEAASGKEQLAGDER